MARNRGYGCTNWRDGRKLEGADRLNFLRNLYVQQLNAQDATGGARYVRSFSMLNRNDRPIYDFVFATNHPTGIDKLKDALWKVGATGGERFSDATDPGQATLMDGAEAHDLGLVEMLCRGFHGQTVSWPEIEARIRD